MSGIALTIDGSDLQKLAAEADALGAELSGSELKLRAGRSMRDTIREYLEALSRDSEHHQWAQALGAERTGFYEAAAQSTQAPVLEGDGVSVSIDHEGLAQRFFGGTIEAQPGHFLTIPAQAAAYGHRAREFSNLRLIIFGHTGLAALVEKDAPADEGSVYYWLVRSVTQPPDRSVLPSDEQILDPAIASIRDYIEQVSERIVD